jgi:hypothetical protein
MTQMDAIGGVPWYRLLNREQWSVLIASNLGWLFDGFEIYALFLTVGFALKQLLDIGQAAAIPPPAGRPVRRLCNSHFALRQEHCYPCRSGPI